MVSNEKFMQGLYPYLSKLKVRYSIGQVGNDRIGTDRWSYMTQWSLSTGADRTAFGYPTMARSPYNQYIEEVIGNPDLTWERSQKQNLGIETGFFKNRLSSNLEFYRDDRSGIFMSASQRTSIPEYFGHKAVSGNIGKVQVKGYEFEASWRDRIGKNFSYYLSVNHTGAFDKIIFREDPELARAYQKNEGYAIGTKVVGIDAGILQNWDDIYSATPYEKDNASQLPGNYRILDFSPDGIIDTYDNAPYSYPVGRPQHTYGWTLGFDYKGFSAMAQFYGVYNVLMSYIGTFQWPFYGNSANTGPVFEGIQTTDMWLPTNADAQRKAARLKMEPTPGQGTFSLGDGSYLRLKNVEIAYTFDRGFVKKLGMSAVKVYLNGNNLIFWGDMIEDREEIGSDNLNVSSYPIARRFNLGINVTL
jgi:hypothetical protein